MSGGDALKVMLPILRRPHVQERRDMNVHEALHVPVCKCWSSLAIAPCTFTPPIPFFLFSFTSPVPPLPSCRYVGRLFVKPGNKPNDIKPRLLQMAGLADSDELLLFEVRRAARVCRMMRSA